MEQLTCSAKVNLSRKEKKNVFLAIACGCLNTIHDGIPGPLHQKQKRVLRTLAESLLKYVSPRIPAVEPNNMPLFRETIMASGNVLDNILDESGTSGLHVMLNLAGFCMEELPVSDSLMQKYNALFDLWEGAYRYTDTKSGERIFHRIESEVNILVAQRGGTIY